MSEFRPWWLPPEPNPKPPFDLSSLLSKPVNIPTKLEPRISSGWLSPLIEPPPKPKVFVSYHHRNDQWWCDRFSELFSDIYELFTDTSIGRKIDSDDAEYQSRVIREKHIAGSSITIVLCGAETWKRKHVDWEIHATLEKQHALLGIILPTHLKNWNGEIVVPDRLNDNVRSAYARWMYWSGKPADVSKGIEIAKGAALAKLIDNSREQMGRNLP